LFDILYALQSVGQITDEAQPPGHYCSNTAAGPSTTEDEVTPKRKREVNVAGGKGLSLLCKDRK
ncbi:hypothetical protein ACQP3D_29130, partial [Escherichia coli]